MEAQDGLTPKLEPSMFLSPRLSLKERLDGHRWVTHAGPRRHGELRWPNGGPETKAVVEKKTLMKKKMLRETEKEAFNHKVDFGQRGLEHKLAVLSE